MSSPEKSKHTTAMGKVPMAVAVGAMFIWVAFIIVLVIGVESDSETWTRLTFVFGSVQAIAFAAAGALFGVTVQEGRVQKAEETAETHAKDAANGRALAAVTIADSPDRAGPAPELDEEGGYSFGVDTDDPDRVTRNRHAAIARSLFPDL